jgi:hypothetical protein
MGILLAVMGLIPIVFFAIYLPTQEAKKYRIQKLGQEARRAISSLTDEFVKDILENTNKKENKNGNK